MDGSLGREKGLSVCKSIKHVDVTWWIPLDGYTIGHKYCDINLPDLKNIDINVTQCRVTGSSPGSATGVKRTPLT